jgi:DNA-binding HxlR family transcriptional regulator
MKESKINLCPLVQKGMDLISKRWNGLIIQTLLTGSHRFSEIEASIPISGRLLSERLKELEKEGIVTREVFSEVPIRVEYSLTEKGLALTPIIREVENWSKKWVSVEETE